MTESDFAQIHDDERFEDPRTNSRGETKLVLYDGHVEQMVDVLENEHGVEVVEKTRGDASGNWIATIEKQ